VNLLALADLIFIENGLERDGWGDVDYKYKLR
jgi:hypothetical protein